MFISLPTGKQLELKSNGVRSSYADDPDRCQVEIAKAYLAACKPSKSKTECSYILKGKAERYGGKFRYVSNGSMILAASELGLELIDRGARHNLQIRIKSVPETLEQMVEVYRLPKGTTWPEAR